MSSYTSTVFATPQEFEEHLKKAEVLVEEQTFNALKKVPDEEVGLDTKVCKAQLVGSKIQLLCVNNIVRCEIDLADYIKADGNTLERDETGALICKGIKDQNSLKTYSVWFGTEEQYKNITAKTPKTIYFYTSEFEQQVLSAISRLQEADKQNVKKTNTESVEISTTKGSVGLKNETTGSSVSIEDDIVVDANKDVEISAGQDANISADSQVNISSKGGTKVNSDGSVEVKSKTTVLIEGANDVFVKGGSDSSHNVTDLFRENGTEKVKRAENVTGKINGVPISEIFESDGKTAKNTNNAKNAENVTKSINGMRLVDIFNSTTADDGTETMLPQVKEAFKANIAVLADGVLSCSLSDSWHTASGKSFTVSGSVNSFVAIRVYTHEACCVTRFIPLIAGVHVIEWKIPEISWGGSSPLCGTWYATVTRRGTNAATIELTALSSLGVDQTDYVVGKKPISYKVLK